VYVNLFWSESSSTDVWSQFFSSYTTLVMSSNYVTKRQSLKLLGEILLDRANFNVMTK
jgi:calcium binding protein 39